MVGCEWLSEDRVVHPYKPGVVFEGHSQAVLNQIRSLKMQQLSRFERKWWLLYGYCFLDVMAVIILRFFLMSPKVGLQCVIVAFPGHTHLLLIRLSTGCFQKFQFKIKQR